MIHYYVIFIHLEIWKKSVRSDWNEKVNITRDLLKETCTYISDLITRFYKPYKIKTNILNIEKCVKNNEKHFTWKNVFES